MPFNFGLSAISSCTFGRNIAEMMLCPSQCKISGDTWFLFVPFIDDVTLSFWLRRHPQVSPHYYMAPVFPYVINKSLVERWEIIWDYVNILSVIILYPLVLASTADSFPVWDSYYCGCQTRFLKHYLLVLFVFTWQTRPKICLKWAIGLYNLLCIC